MKRIGLVLSGFIGLLFVIPIMFSVFNQIGPLDMTVESADKTTDSKPVDSSETTNDSNALETVTVFRVEDETYDEIPLEEYIIGVVSGEMPASYDEEALKAQAVAARSYTTKKIEAEGKMYDSVKHQVYLDEAQLKERWGDNYDKYHQKITDAVLATAGEVIYYEDEVIEPLYFAMSNGKTENAEDYWGSEIPYLRSVSSEWDTTSEKYEQQVEFDVIKICDIFKLDKISQAKFEVLERTEGGNIAQILIGDRVYTGKEVRELLQLRSTDFSVSVEADTVVITTRGYGHEVGMSQYGANELAKQGKTYDEILNYYYQDIEVK